MPRVERRETPPAFLEPESLKFYLRRDFRYRCAYCTIHEAENQGHESFEVEHFRPIGIFPELGVAYGNLYYACARCNRFKGAAWPSGEQTSAGLRFLDPCDDDPDEHWEEDAEGRLIPRTPVGYTIARVRLNRQQLLSLRRYRRQSDGRLIRKLAELYSQSAVLSQALRSPGLDAATQATLAHAREFLVRRARQALADHLQRWEPPYEMDPPPPPSSRRRPS